MSEETEEITHIKQLKFDPKNARQHTPRGVGMIREGMGEVGAARSIVIDEDGIIRAGNASVEAAAEAGITKVMVVDTDGETLVAVRRSGLTEEQKVKLGLYDNRTAEFSSWDAQQIAEFAGQGIDLSKMWRPDEFTALVEGAVLDLGLNGDGSGDFAEGDQFTDSGYKAVIGMTPQQSNDSELKADLSAFCDRWGLSYRMERG